MSAKDLYSSINKNLKTDTVWTKEQYEIYCVLKLLLQENNLSKKIYKVNKNHKDFLQFMHEQEWYKNDKDKLYVHDMIKYCMLVEQPINNSEGVKITLFFKNFETYLNGFFDKKLNIFYIYFSKNNKKNAYIAYYNTHKDTREQHNMRLPEFEKIYETTGFIDTMLKKGSLVRFVVDVFRFYKCEILLHLSVGLRYNVTLEQIYSQIRV